MRLATSHASGNNLIVVIREIKMTCADLFRNFLDSVKSCLGQPTLWTLLYINHCNTETVQEEGLSGFVSEEVD